jgi:hypothetical protein
MILSMTVYGIVWNIYQKKAAAREADRRAQLTDQGFGEKSVDRSYEDGRRI